MPSCCLPILSSLGGDTHRFLDRTATLQWALMVCVFCISHVPALAMLEIPGFEGRSLLLLAFLVIVVQGSDVLQYVFGKLFGRRKLAPALSPLQDLGGPAGRRRRGHAAGRRAAWHHAVHRPLEAGAIAFVLCAMGFLGGLVMSAIKRDRGIKGLGHADRRPRRHAGPAGFGDLRGARVLPPGALFLDPLTPHRRDCHDPQ